MIYTHEELQKGFHIKADVCVIGSGAAGAVITKELSERGVNVALLEEGSHFTNKDFHGPIHERIRKFYHNAGFQMAIGKPAFLVPSGRAIGGSTLVNAGTSLRALPKVYKRWHAEFGMPFSYEVFVPFLDRVSKMIHIEKADPEVAGRANSIFKEGTEKLKYSGDWIARNIDGCTGCNLCTFGCPVDAKKSVNLNYIPLAEKNGAKIYANCRVEKLVHKDGTAAGVTGNVVTPEGIPIADFSVDAEFVILCGGAVMSPIFLFKNSICNASGQVGKNLTVQPVSEGVGLFKEKIKGSIGMPQGYYVTEFEESRGIVIEVAFPPPEIFAMKFASFGVEHKANMKKYQYATAAHALIAGNANGHIQLTSEGAPRIFYSLDEEESSLLYEGMKHICEILLASGAYEVYPVTAHQNALKTKEDIEKFFSPPPPKDDLLLLCYHPLGTCRLGTDAKTAVVKPDFEAYDMKNFYICDGSIFPTPLGTNPQVTIMAMATYFAEEIFMKEKLKINLKGKERKADS